MSTMSNQSLSAPMHSEKDVRKATFEVCKGTISEALRNLEERLRLVYPQQKPYVTLESPGTHLEPAGDRPFRPFLEGDPMVNHAERGRLALVFRPAGQEPLIAFVGREAVTKMDHAFRDIVDVWVSDALVGLRQEQDTETPAVESPQPSGLRGVSRRLEEDLDLTKLRLLTALDQPAYNTPLKVAKRNGSPRTAVQYAAVRDIEAAAKAVRAYAPQWSKQDHARLAQAHERLSKHCDLEWGRVADEAAQAAFGRPFNILKGDYKISGIGREEFSPAHKAQLRTLAHRETDHKYLAAVHDHIVRHSRNLPLESALGEDGPMGIPEARAHAIHHMFFATLRLLTREEKVRSLGREIGTLDYAAKATGTASLEGLPEEERTECVEIYRKLLEGTREMLEGLGEGVRA
jgi:hypothetical protein